VGNGLMDLDAAAAWTGRTRKSLHRLYQRGLLIPADETDECGRRLFPFVQLEPLRRQGRPSELLAA
jgi:hypothetical protein